MHILKLPDGRQCLCSYIVMSHHLKEMLAYLPSFIEECESIGELVCVLPMQHIAIICTHIPFLQESYLHMKQEPILSCYGQEIEVHEKVYVENIFHCKTMCSLNVLCFDICTSDVSWITKFSFNIMYVEQHTNLSCIWHSEHCSQCVNYQSDFFWLHVLGYSDKYLPGYIYLVG